MNEGEELKTFLESVLQSQSATNLDVTWRNTGRSFALFFLGALDAGVDAQQALNITATYQAAFMNMIKAQSQQPPAGG